MTCSHCSTPIRHTFLQDFAIFSKCPNETANMLADHNMSCHLVWSRQQNLMTCWPTFPIFSQNIDVSATTCHLGGSADTTGHHHFRLRCKWSSSTVNLRACQTCSRAQRQTRQPNRLCFSRMLILQYTCCKCALSNGSGSTTSWTTPL